MKYVHAKEVEIVSQGYEVVETSKSRLKKPDVIIGFFISQGLYTDYP